MPPSFHRSPAPPRTRWPPDLAIEELDMRMYRLLVAAPPKAPLNKPLTMEATRSVGM
jgi:hypothetical protein